MQLSGPATGRRSERRRMVVCPHAQFRTRRTELAEGRLNGNCRPCSRLWCIFRVRMHSLCWCCNQSWHVSRLRMHSLCWCCNRYSCISRVWMYSLWNWAHFKKMHRFQPTRDSRGRRLWMWNRTLHHQVSSLFIRVTSVSPWWALMNQETTECTLSSDLVLFHTSMR